MKISVSMYEMEMLSYSVSLFLMRCLVKGLSVWSVFLVNVVRKLYEVWYCLIIYGPPEVFIINSTDKWLHTFRRQ